MKNTTISENGKLIFELLSRLWMRKIFVMKMISGMALQKRIIINFGEMHRFLDIESHLNVKCLRKLIFCRQKFAKFEVLCNGKLNSF